MIVVPPRTYKNMTLCCTRCETDVVVNVARPDKWRYCPKCLEIVTKERRQRNAANAKKKLRPRIVRHAGYDPSERH